MRLGTDGLSTALSPKILLGRLSSILVLTSIQKEEPEDHLILFWIFLGEELFSRT